MLSISSLEGTLMISRLEGKRDALLAARLHLAKYLDKDVRAHSTCPRTSKLPGDPRQPRITRKT